MSNKEHSGSNRRISRRTFVRVTGTGSLVGLAGCSNDTNDGNDGNGNESPTESPTTGDGTTEDGNQVVKQEFVYPINAPPREIKTWNIFATGFQGDYRGFFYERPAYFHRGKRKYINNGYLKDWSIDGKGATLHLNDDYTWSNGDPLTAQDLFVQAILKKNVDGWPTYLESVHVEDSTTLRYETGTKVNDRLFTNYLMDRWAAVKASVYGEFFERYQNATSDAERRSITEDLTGAGDTDPFMIKDPLVTGPFEVDEVAGTELLGKRNENYARKENINFTGTKGVYYGSPQKIWQGLKTGSIDGTGPLVSVPTPVAQTFPDSLLSVEQPCYCGLCAVFQYRNQLLQNRKVRWALAYVMNPKQIAKSMRQGRYEVVEIPCGLHANVDYWLGKYKDSFNTYGPYSSDTERAAELLRDEGFTRENGEWYKPDGELWNVTVATGSKAAWHTFAVVLVNQLESFGISAQVRSTDQNTYYSTVYSQGNFNDIGIAWSWNGTPYPYNGFYLDFQFVESHAASGYPEPPGSENTWVVDVPPLGEPNGELRKFNIDELLKEATVTTDDERLRKIFQTLAWIYNWDLPRVPVEHKINQEWLNENGWNVPSPGDSVYKTDPEAFIYYLPRIGALTAETT